MTSYSRVITTCGRVITSYGKPITSYGRVLHGYDRMITSYRWAITILITLTNDCTDYQADQQVSLHIAVRECLEEHGYYYNRLRIHGTIYIIHSLNF